MKPNIIQFLYTSLYLFPLGLAFFSATQYGGPSSMRNIRPKFLCNLY